MDQESEATFLDLPEKTQAELRKLRQEAQQLRRKNKDLAEQVLTARYGPDIVAMIPEEVTTYQRKVELAESYAATRRPEPEPEPEVEPLGLAAVLRAPTSANRAATGELLTTAEIKQLHKSDPVAADALFRAGKFQRAQEMDR